MSKKDRKPFKETAFVKFVQKAKDNAGIVLDVGLDIAQGNFTDAIKTVGDELGRRKDQDEKSQALFYEFEHFKLEFEKEMRALELEHQKEITKRWESDNQGSWMSRNVRPIILFYLTLVFSLVIILDSIPGIIFTIDEGYKSLIQSIWITTIGGYFVVRTVDKYQTKK